MRSPSRIALGLFVSAAFTLPVWGQGTISDAPVNFVRGASPFDATPGADLTGAGTGDQLFEAGWAFRVSGDTRETFFPVPTTQSYTSPTSTIDWADVAARGLFSAQEISVVKNTGGPSGIVTMTMKITNLSASNPLQIEMFHGVDIDAGGSAGTDVGTLLYRNNHIRVTDGATRIDYRGVGAKAYMARAFAATTDVFGLLDNAAVNDWDNTGLPFASGDITASFQWSLNIPASGSASVTAVIAANTSLVRGDFGDDAKTDLLLRNSLFTKHVVWQMDGLTRTAGLVVTPDVVDTNLRGVCTEDFNGDAKTDILFQNVATGALEIWVMGGTNGTDQQSVLPVTGAPALPGTITDWSVAACGDVNRDGKNDILWRNNATVAADPVNGQKLRTWLMNNEAWVADLIPTPNQAVDGNWQVTALLDYDADGNTDFLWYNYTSGRIVQWFMDPSFVRITGAFTSPNAAGDNNWKVVASGEYGRGAIDVPPTGAGDIIWRNENSGRIVGWLMDGITNLPTNGNTRVHGQFACPVEVGGTCNPLDPPSPTATSWFIVGPR